ncbi:ferritin-like domain-containing protein [Fibrella sp. WM1]|uniref:ferritin-like domain-containing protein n=1 Tax=Fibrella musci TaxID=3242485 RepID=UPI003522D84A
MEIGTKKTPTPTTPGEFVEQVGRRRFLRYAGFSVAMTSVILAACENKDSAVAPGADRGARAAGDTVDLGSGNIAILNYAYALEQLEAAFYDQVIKTPYKDITTREFELLKEIRNHEIVHAEFFKAALGAAGLPALTPDFSSIDFTDRLFVLNQARQFEDVGVSAYNGAGRLLTDASLLLVAGKIVSVEARHAGLIRTLTLSPSTGFFAGDDVVNNNGLDVVRTPAEVLPIAQRYIKEKITANSVPVM